MPSAVPTPGRARRLPPWLPFVVGVLLLIVYWPALHGAALWDDQAHLTAPALQSWSGLGQIWFNLGATQQYYPLVHTVFWLEHRCWGDATLGYHLANLFWHGTSACLFALALMRLGFGRATAACAALLFTLHPVMVESVAWMSEQKNTLSLVFYLAAALYYLRFDSGRRSLDYAVGTLLFLCALATKSVTATLPAALGVVLWWKRGRLDFKRDLVPLAVWLAMGLGAGLFTAHVEKTIIGAEGADFALSGWQRGLLAGRVVWFYLGKLLWPSPLIWVYPHWEMDRAAGLGLAAVLAAAAFTAILAWFAFRQTGADRGPLAAWLFFVGSLFPVLGFVNVYPFRFSYVADHFQYLPALAIFALLGAAARFVPYAAAGLVLSILGTLSRIHSAEFADQIGLYRATLAKNPSAWMPEYNLGMLLHERGEDAEAVRHYRRALDLRPDYPEVYANWGALLDQSGHPAEAAEKELAALELKPSYPEALNTLGLALTQMGRTEEGRTQFEAAIRAKPDFAPAYFNLGNCDRKAGMLAMAETEYEASLGLDPQYAEAHLNLGNLKLAEGDLPAAVGHFQAVVAARPNYAEAHNSLGSALARAGNAAGAIKQYQEAVRLKPDYRAAWMNLAAIYHRTGREAEARQILASLGRH